MRKLFSCLHGSRLFGTSTPTSDLDIKHVVLPPIEDLLLGKKISNKVKKTNTGPSKNGPDDVDEELVPLQVFARDFLEGQTYAIEMAFAIDGDHAEQTFYDLEGNVVSKERSPFYKITLELRESYLTSNIKAMIGYVVNQAKLYSNKGERYNAARDVHSLLMNLSDPTGGEQRLGDAYRREPETFAPLLKAHSKYFQKVVYDIGNGEMRDCLTLLSKTLPFSNTVNHTIKTVTSTKNTFGTRAHEAGKDNVDWKAMMHALRIVNEGIELLTHGRLTLPVDPVVALFYLSIKRGEYPLDVLTDQLNTKLDSLKQLELSTDLPSYTPELVASFDAWLTRELISLYTPLLKPSF
jgi:hypothetical protein